MNSTEKLLLKAIEKNQPKTVEYLISPPPKGCGVDPTIKNNTALKSACEHGHLELVKMLLQDKRVNPSANNNEALNSAISADCLKIVELFLKDKRIQINHSVIIIALHSYNDKIVKMLLKNCKINLSDDNNYIIKYAASENLIETVKFLLEKSEVDPTVEDNYPFRMACRKGRLEVVKILLQDPRIDPSADDNYAFRWSSRYGHIEIVKLLLMDKRVDPSAGDNHALRMAARFGHLDVVELLLQDDRVDPTAQNYDAIKKASENGNFDIIMLLLKDKRVNLYAVKISPANNAVWTRKLIKLLKEKNTNSDNPDTKKETNKNKSKSNTKQKNANQENSPKTTKSCFNVKQKKEIKSLFGYACAICYKFIEDSGQCAHIISASQKKQGPRHYSKIYGDIDHISALKVVDHINNGLYLCYECHKDIDTNVSKYTVGKLQTCRTLSLLKYKDLELNEIEEYRKYNLTLKKSQKLIEKIKKYSLLGKLITIEGQVFDFIDNDLVKLSSYDGFTVIKEMLETDYFYKITNIVVLFYPIIQIIGNHLRKKSEYYDFYEKNISNQIVEILNVRTKIFFKEPDKITDETIIYVWLWVISRPNKREYIIKNGLEYKKDYSKKKEIFDYLIKCCNEKYFNDGIFDPNEIMFECWKKHQIDFYCGGKLLFKPI